MSSCRRSGARQNGQGLEDDFQAGRGLKNMRRRAGSIDCRLDMESTSEAIRICLFLPTDPEK